MVRKMIVVNYSGDWPEMYEKEAAQIRAALADVLVRCHHMGSTSVPGLAAKPIIDILLEVRSLDRLDARNAAMESLGYTPKGAFGIPGRRYYPKGADKRTHHAHAFAAGDPHIEKHLVFRDYLRAHPLAAAEYAAIKRQAAEAHANDPEGYVAFKHDFAEPMVAEAVHWASDRD